MPFNDGVTPEPGNGDFSCFSQKPNQKENIADYSNVLGFYAANDSNLGKGGSIHSIVEGNLMKIDLNSKRNIFGSTQVIKSTAPFQNDDDLMSGFSRLAPTVEKK